MLATTATRVLGERRVDAAVHELVRPGDCVWDVGAHSGTYTRQFLETVGSTGQVVAFEPIPRSAASLRELGSEPELIVFEGALADTDGKTSFVLSGPTFDTSGRSHIGDDSSDAITVRVARGDSLLREGMRQPDVVKIDVEGYEGEVLDGMPETLKNTRGVVVEVHFAELTRRDMPDEALRIVELLRGDKFNVRWVDPSHLLAVR
jgi:FkbM family methyltransferase